MTGKVVSYEKLVPCTVITVIRFVIRLSLIPPNVTIVGYQGCCSFARSDNSGSALCIQMSHLRSSLVCFFNAFFMSFLDISLRRSNLIRICCPSHKREAQRIKDDTFAKPRYSMLADEKSYMVFITFMRVGIGFVESDRFA